MNKNKKKTPLCPFIFDFYKILVWVWGLSAQKAKHDNYTASKNARNLEILLCLTHR